VSASACGIIFAFYIDWKENMQSWPALSENVEDFENKFKWKHWTKSAQFKGIFIVLAVYYTDPISRLGLCGRESAGEMLVVEGMPLWPIVPKKESLRGT